MPRVITGEHQWVVAAWIDVDDKQAAWAVRRGNVHVDGPFTAEACDTICAMCRRPWDDVSDKPCSAAQDNSHLRGGHLDKHRRPRTGAGEAAV